MGHQFQNGTCSVPDRIGPRRMINRTEYIRLLQQALYRIGYSDVAEHLASESGIQMQPREATDFQNKVLTGDWDGALELLPELTRSEEAMRGVKFLIYQQKYLEAVEAEDLTLALHCLRRELAPLQVNEHQLHQLAGLLLHGPNEDIRGRLSWTDRGAGGLSDGNRGRSHLLAQLQARLPPSLLIPEGRLEQLLEQALAYQIQLCRYHNTLNGHISLFKDYKVGVESLPTQCAQVLEDHRDEVWHLAFSHSGAMLATAGKDHTVILWAIKPSGTAVKVHILQGHDDGVNLVSWSPDDRLLLTCSDDTTLRLWDTAEGQVVHTYRQHRGAVTACTWLPDGLRFLSGSPDKCVIMHHIDGRELQRWKRPLAIQDMAVTHDGRFLLIACSTDNLLQIVRLSDRQEGSLQESVPVTSIALSPDSRHVLTNLQNQTIHCWDLGELLTSDLTHYLGDLLPHVHQGEYKSSDGEKGRFVLRSSFGGNESSFVVHGGEDCQVYIWHRDSSELLVKLEGHTGTVNAVSWNPRNPYMMASASDDKTIRIWLAQAFTGDPSRPSAGVGGDSMPVSMEQ